MAISEFILLNGTRGEASSCQTFHAIHRGTAVGSPTRTCAPGARFSPDTAISDSSLPLTRHSRRPLPDRCMAISFCELLTPVVMSFVSRFLSFHAAGRTNFQMWNTWRVPHEVRIFTCPTGFKLAQAASCKDRPPVFDRFFRKFGAGLPPS